jgi:hypothetical protein
MGTNSLSSTILSACDKEQLLNDVSLPHDSSNLV